MQELNQKKWKAIPIIDLFRLPFVPGKGKGLNHLQQTTAGGVSYIGATNRNNGVLCFIEKTDYTHKLIQKGNCIGFIKNGDGAAGYSIYKKEQFISTSDVIYGYADWLTMDNALFFIAAQDKIEKKYSHGYKRNQLHLRGDKVMLPISTSGNPDYEYMAEYVREKRHVMLTKYRTLLKKRIAELGEHVRIPSLGEKEWLKFKVFKKKGKAKDKGLFNIDATSSSVDGIRLIAGNDDSIPYVTRSESNNGIAKFVSEKNLVYGYDAKGSITIGLDTQTAFWQPHEFITGQNIHIVTGDKINEYVAQFIIPLLRNQMKAKFNWGGNGATLGRLNHLEMLLPVSDIGEPDYDYMEQYIKNMMIQKYKQYLTFLDKKAEKL